MKFLRLDWQEITSIRLSNDKQKSSKKENVEKILEKFRKVFEPEIGKLTNIRGKLTLQNGAQPKFYMPREVAYSLRLRVEEELERLQQEGIISSIECSD